MPRNWSQILNRIVVSKSKEYQSIQGKKNIEKQ